MRLTLKARFGDLPGGLFMTLHGSRLFGVDGPDSDWDVKAVSLPSADRLLLGHRNALTPTEDRFDGGEVTVHAVQHFFAMLREADTNALNMLFAARSAHGLLGVSTTGRRFLDQLDTSRVVHRSLSGALGFARSQVVKYSRKGERLGLLEALHARLEANPTARTGEALGVTDADSFHALRDSLTAAGVSTESLELEERPSSHGGMQRFLQVAGKRLELNAKAAYNRDVVAGAVRHYGERAREAQADGGRDLKAWYHALRVAGEAVELHETGALTFPRPDAPFLRRVREGAYEQEQLTEMLEARLDQAEQAEATSALAERFDEAYAQELVLELYGRR